MVATVNESTGPMGSMECSVKEEREASAASSDDQVSE
jgi:hypothetical protein